MILRSLRNICQEGLSADKLYPVIAYEIEIKTGKKRFQIVDDCRSLSWKTGDLFEVVSDTMDGFVKTDNSKTIAKYTYTDLAKEDFWINYYLENEDSVIANNQLEKTLISIYSNELSTDKLLYNLDIIRYRGENADILLKAFFKKANYETKIASARTVYDKIREMDDYIVQIIVEKLSDFKEKEVENLFLELYMNQLTGSNNTQDIIR